jgi:two-component system KDP operon response regulator KdpE
MDVYALGEEGTMKVLIIEDDPIIQGLTNDLVQQNGYETITASSFDEAERAIASESPDIVVTDLMLPDMSGISLLYALRDKRIPIITLSGLSREVVIEQLLNELGIMAVLEKPLMLKDLTVALESAAFKRAS